MKLTYQKCFNLGHYENEVIRLESDEFVGALDEVFFSLKNAVESLHDKSVAKDEEIRAERNRLKLEKIAEERQKKLEHDAEMRKIHPCYDCVRFDWCDRLNYDSADAPEICEEYEDDPFGDD